MYDYGSEPGLLGYLIAFAIVSAIWIVIGAFVAWLLYRANEALPAEHRRAESWQAFLLLIPLFGLIWNFVFLARVSGGMQSYFGTKNDTTVGDCGAAIGLWFSISAVCMWIPLVGCIALPAAIVLLIIYLVKVSGLRTRILAG